MSTVHSSIEHHPDLLALRANYDRAAESLAAQFTFGLALLTGVYVAISPWVVGFDNTRQLARNDLIVGVAVAALAFCFASALDRTHGMTWTLPVFGVWLVTSPWILHGMSATPGMIWSNVVAGVLLTALGLTAVYFGMRARGDATTHG